jgi:hypothetical protein
MLTTRLLVGGREWLRIRTTIKGVELICWVDSEGRQYIPRPLVARLSGKPNNYLTKFALGKVDIKNLPIVREPGTSTKFQLIPVDLAVSFWIHWLPHKETEDDLSGFLSDLARDDLSQILRNQIKESERLKEET